VTVSGESQTGEMVSEESASVEQVSDIVDESEPKAEAEEVSVIEEIPVEKAESKQPIVQNTEIKKEKQNNRKREPQEFTTPAERKMVTGGNTFWKHA
jgi:hypothetical protein